VYSTLFADNYSFTALAVLRWSSIVRKEVDVGAVRGESQDPCMAGGVRFPDRRKGLVPGVDKSI
jgi:hypothetical protein